MYRCQHQHTFYVDTRRVVGWKQYYGTLNFSERWEAFTKMMQCEILSILASAFFIDISVGLWMPAGESQSFMFATTKDSSATIYWNLQMETVNTTLFICSPFLETECDPFRNSILDLYSANITSNSSSFISVLTIKYVTPLQHHTRWYCFADTQLGVTSSAQYDLNVFAAAEIPTCNAVTLINEINIQISCSTQKVFPGSLCIFYININSSSEHELDQGSISYTHQQNATTGYYKTNCTYTLSAAILGPGSHMFRADIYPNITSNITEMIKTTSQYTSPITIGYPKAVLGTNCYLKDFIKENETGICTCYDNNTSFLQTQVTWSTGNSKNGTLNFTARRPTHTEMSFQCMVSNILNFTNVIIYTPIIAYPPDIILTLNNAELDLCPDENHDIYGNCSVSDSYPSSSVSIYINNVLLDANHVSKSIDHRFNTSYTSSGVVNVTCLAYNVAFSVSKTKYLTIKGPPEPPNIFELVKKETLSSSKISQLAIIMCQSRGGVPSSKQLSLTCNTMETDATNGDTVTLEVNMTRDPTDVNCTCVVLHESKCLKNKTTETLRLSLLDDSSPVEINSATIAVGITLGLGLLVSISVNIFIIRRSKRIKRDDSSTRKSNSKKRQEYNDISATPYVNTELHAYETANITPNYLNDVTTFSTSQRVVKTDINQWADKEDHPYDEVTELK